MTEVVLHQRYSASSIGAASAAMHAVFGGGDFEAGAGPFRYEQLSLVDDGISVARVASHGADVRVRTEHSPDLGVLAVKDGSLRITRGDDDAVLRAGDLVLLPLGDTVELGWERVAFDVFSFPQSSVRRLMGVREGPVRMRAPRLVPLSPKLAGLWLRLSGLVAAHVLEEPELYERDQIRDQLLDALLGATIETFDLTNAEEDDVSSDAGVVARAEGYMLRHLGRPISIPDVARAAGVSVRGLQLAFQRHVGMAPLVRLRELRLARARELLTGASGPTTVSGVARSLGYSNLGRFSEHYRAAFGETPSTTLRRTTAPG